MSRSIKKHRMLSRGTLGLGATLALLIGLGVLAVAGTAATAAIPANTASPTVKGTAQEGEKLTGDRGTWSDRPTDYAYAWARCDRTGATCADIAGATRTTYTLGLTDVGSSLRFKVQATNKDGSTSASSVPTAVIAAATPPVLAPPQITSPPTVTGTAQEGQKLSGNKGKWSGSPTGYDYLWTRCDRNGATCADIGGATSTSYTLGSADVGSSLRFNVQATNRDGSTSASSVPTAVIASATKPVPTPSATGCPAGSGSIQAASLAPPARLLIDQQQTTPTLVVRGTRQLTLRYHVSACGRPVQGALVYVAVVPFNALSIPPEQATDQSGWAALSLSMLDGFPVSNRQQLITIFVRARKSGDDLLAGSSTRRLFSVRVDLMQ